MIHQTGKVTWVAVAMFLLIAVVVVVTGSLGYVYFASERYLKDVSPKAEFRWSGAEDQATIDRGRHIARTRGCFGCHGQELEGEVFTDEWSWVGTAVAPNLAIYARDHEPGLIEAAVRQGIGHDGKALWSMPAYNFVLLNDEDMDALISFLRSAPVVEKDLPEPDIGWEVRTLIVRGAAQHMVEWAERMPPLKLGPDDDPQLVRGEYLAKTTCNECHGFDLRGSHDPEWPVPDLAIVGAYTDQDFRKLMKTGEAIGGRDDLRLMSMVARDRFASFTDEELGDLLTYLRTLPETPPDPDASWRDLR